MKSLGQNWETQQAISPVYVAKHCLVVTSEGPHLQVLGKNSISHLMVRINPSTRSYDWAAYLPGIFKSFTNVGFFVVEKFAFVRITGAVLLR